jgi:hypothetical protein
LSTSKLLVLAVVLVALVLVFANPFQDQIRKDNPERTQLFASEDIHRTDRLEIRTGPGVEPVVLARHGEDWVVASRGDFPADTSATSTMVRALGNAKITGVASKNPENRSKFQVDSTGVDVAAFAGDQRIGRFTLGRIGQEFTTSYLRLDGSDEVLVVRGLNRNLFARTQGYRDRTLFKFEVDAVQSIRARTPEEEWEIVRGDTAWMVRGGDAFDPVAAQQSVVDQLIGSLSTLSADGFLDTVPDTLDTGLAAPGHAFTVRFMDGSEVKIAIGGVNDANQRYVTRPDRSAIYLMGDWRLNNSAKSYADLTSSP